MTMSHVRVRANSQVIIVTYHGVMDESLLRDTHQRMHQALQASTIGVIHDTRDMPRPDFKLALLMKQFDQEFSRHVQKTATVTNDAGIGLLARIAFAFSADHKAFGSEEEAYQWIVKGSLNPSYGS